jgi:hypothetical protein
MDEHVDELAPLIAELRRPVAADAASVAATKAAVAAAARGPRGRLRRWMRELRAAVPLPAQGVAAALGAALLLLLLTRIPPGRPAANPDAPVVVARAGGARVVRFRLVAEGAHRVTVVGDFNDWDSRATPLRPAGAGGAWSVAVPIAPGRYSYAFVIDGVTWKADPAALPAPGDDYGRPSSLLLVDPSRS